MARLGSLTGDVALDVVERPDPIKGCAGDLGFGGLPDVMEVPSQMRPARGLAEAGRAAVRFGKVELGVALVAICL